TGLGLQFVDDLPSQGPVQHRIESTSLLRVGEHLPIIPQARFGEGRELGEVRVLRVHHLYARPLAALRNRTIGSIRCVTSIRLTLLWLGTDSRPCHVPV